MKALVLKAHGGLDALTVVSDYPLPRAVEGHVVIRVRASSFNYHDVFTVKGMPGIKVPLPVIIGLDTAGEISEVGAGVSNWKIGDRVLVNPLNKQKGLMGEMLDGGMAEYCLVAVDQLVAMPDGVSFEDAASLPVAYGTAHRMLITHKTVKHGDRMIVLGASGGVGTGCVLLGKMLGCEVIACASSDEKLRRLKEMGADEVVDYTKTDWSKWAVEKYGKPQRRTYDGGVDVVVNFTGGDTWYPSWGSDDRLYSPFMDGFIFGGVGVSALSDPPTMGWAIQEGDSAAEVEVAGGVGAFLFQNMGLCCPERPIIQKVQ
jgi:alcohol dehydrogenase